MPVTGKQAECPDPGDRVDGPGGRRIVVRRQRALVAIDTKTKALSLARRPKVVWRRPRETKHYVCLLSTWRRWVRSA